MADHYTKAQIDALATIIGQRIKANAGGSGGGNAGYLGGTGRYLLDTARDWTTDSSYDYGYSEANKNRQIPFTDTPVLPWAWMGYHIPAGTIVNSFHIAGLINGNAGDVAELEIRGYFRTPNDPALLVSGVSIDSHMTNTELFNIGFYNQFGFTGLNKYRHAGTMDLAVPFEAPTDGQLTIIMRSSTVPPLNRNFYGETGWGVTYPA